MLLSAPLGLDEFQRCAEEVEVLLMLGRVGAVDLNPFPRGSGAQTPGLELRDVAPRELQVGHRGGRQAQPYAVAAEAGEHPVVDEVGVEGVELLGDDAGK